MPAVEGRQSEDQRAGPGYQRSDVRHESENEYQHAPERRVGHADQHQAKEENDSEAPVDSELEKEVPADASCGLVNGGGGDNQHAIAAEPQHAIAKLFAIQQHEEREHTDGENLG